MDFLLASANQTPPSTYAEVRRANPVQPLPSAPTRDAAFTNTLRNTNAKLPLEVRSQLQKLLETLPDPDRLIRQIAQAGPVKPNTFTKPKPQDQPRPLLPSQQVKPNSGNNSQDIKPVLNELAPLLRNLLKVVSDRQEYDINTQVFVAEGNVLIRYKRAELKADRVILNTKTQEVVAEGNVFFKRGDQQIKGTKLTYNYSTVKGELLNASGAIDIGTLQSAEVSRSPADTSSRSLNVAVAGSTSGEQQELRRFGFVAERLILDGDTWTAEKLRVTTDPFSPPEIELVTSKATLTPISPTQNRLDLEAPTIVFDQSFSVPLPLNSLTLDRFQKLAPALVGFDRGDRDGVFYQQSFDVVSQSNLNFQISPQILLQRAFSSKEGFKGFDIFGVLATLTSDLDNGQQLSGRVSLAGLDFSRLESLLRANVSYSIPVFGNHVLLSQYSFRDRIFNGSLGLLDVNNILGTTLISPTYNLGDSKISLKYQIAAQLIGATRADLAPNTVNSLLRVQSAATLSRVFPIFEGQPAPAEKETGLRYSPKPVVPRLDLILSAQGINSFYSNGDNQAVLFGTVGLAAQLGNFAKDFFDYTGLNFAYTQAFVSGSSPFLFDRIVDRRLLTAGIVQQIYGPLRFGLQQSWNLDTGNLFDSVYSLEYVRRTYAVVIRYNPNQGLGEFLLRISDFNWTQPPTNVTNIQNGLELRN